MKKRCIRKHWNKIDTLAHAIQGAAVTDKARLDHLRMLELLAIEAFRKGEATREDWKSLADMTNIAETLARGYVGHEALPDIMAAQEALGAAHGRLQTHGRLGVSGPELQALRAAYEWHNLQRENIPRSRYEQAIRKTAARIKSGAADIKVYV